MTAADSPSLAGRIERVNERMALACQRAGRPIAEVTLIAVSKTWPAKFVTEAQACGLSDFGENRVQEALQKMDAVQALRGGQQIEPAWHLIGHLQTNKVKSITGRFAILHGIDSERLVETVGRFASGPQRVMLEVNVSGEPSKFGVAPGELDQLLKVASSTAKVVVEGLMTVAPRGEVAGSSRPVFRELRSLAERYSLPHLSMGMSDDYEVAIEEGATHVRVGRAIFGDRS